MDFKKNSRRGRLCSEHVVCLSVSAAIIISLIKVAEIAAICLITWRSYQKPCLVDKNTCGHSRNSSHLIISNVTVKAHVDLRDSLYVTGPACELCPLNWIALDGSCYYFSVDRMNWSASKLNCEQMKSDLVSLENSKEKDFIYSQISSRKGHFWIGLKKKNDEWFWETGEKCITQPHAEHNCATIGRDLSPESCSNPNKWICEKKTIKYPSI